MSERETFYCRLCAEPTKESNLISPQQEVAVESKMVTKMLWINIDISKPINFPTSICFACFDALERTYRFLQSVRSAQEKLSEIYTTNEASQVSEKVAQPVDEDWEKFEETKLGVKCESDGQAEAEITYDSNLLRCVSIDVKDEPPSLDDTDQDYDDFKSEDDDLPLLSVSKRKKTRLKFKDDVIAEDLTPSIPFPVITWEDYTWRCGQCDASFQNLQSLRLHSLQIHTNCCVFKCNECSKNFTIFKHFTKHVREHQKLLQYCCEYCYKRFNGGYLLKKHYRTHKTEVLYLMCENCGTVFETADQLQDHVVIYSKEYRKRNDREVDDLKCSVCSKVFKSRSNLMQHKILHTERRRDFSCHMCGKMFFTKGTLRTHMTTHEEVKPFKCEHCSLSFRARGNLQAHMSLHSNTKPFVCEHCGKSFRAKRLLKSHYIIHTDLMPYVCEYCNKTFRFKTRLNMHLRQHTGAKPYTCLYCQRDFTNGSNHKKHMKRRHNIDTSRKKTVEVIQSDDAKVNENTT